MKKNLAALLTAVFLTGSLLAASAASADEQALSIDTHFRAKIAKEKAKAKAREAEQGKLAKAGGKAIDKSACGSQSIGNLDTNGSRVGGPREVFVFAPNAINIVGAGGCR